MSRHFEEREKKPFLFFVFTFPKCDEVDGGGENPSFGQPSGCKFKSKNLSNFLLKKKRTTAHYKFIVVCVFNEFYHRIVKKEYFFLFFIFNRDFRGVLYRCSATIKTTSETPCIEFSNIYTINRFSTDNE